MSSKAVHNYSVDLDEVRRLAVTITAIGMTLEVFQEFPIYKKGTDTTSLPKDTMHSVEECIAIAGLTLEDWADWVMDQNHGPDWREQMVERDSEASADLVEADLVGADLVGADLVGANLAKVNLAKVNLSGANLSGANLSGANLSGANLSGADLSGADLSGADLSGADLWSASHHVNLTEANLSGAVADKDTRWPEGFDPVAAGVIFE